MYEGERDGNKQNLRQTLETFLVTKANENRERRKPAGNQVWSDGGAINRPHQSTDNSMGGSFRHTACNFHTRLFFL